MTGKIERLADDNATRQDITRHCEEGKRSAARRGNLLGKCEKLFREHALALLSLSFRNNISHCNYSGTSQCLIHDKNLTSCASELRARLDGGNDVIIADVNRRPVKRERVRNHLFTRKCKAFTLAEVLITLAVIGIVAVMTIPNLVQNYQSKAWNTADTVFQRKLTEALKIMNTQGTLAGYSSTESFIKELSRHLKITKTCTNSNLTACFSNTVIWGKDNEETDISKLKTAKDFGQNDWKTNIVGFQLASGVTGLMAYNPSCKQDEYSNQITGGDCLAVLYDVQGYTKPNTESKDLRQNGNILALGKKAGCDVEFADHCWTISAADTPLTNAECEEHKAEWGIQNCRSDDNDYWGGAVKKCGGTSNMPTPAQLAQLATQIYGESIGATDDKSGLTIKDNTLYETLHSKSPTAVQSDFYVWSGEEYSNDGAYSRNFNTTRSTYYSNRSNSYRLAVCLGD